MMPPTTAPDDDDVEFSGDHDETVSIHIPNDMKQWQQTIHFFSQEKSQSSSPFTTNAMDDPHDVRSLLSSHNRGDMSWKYEEEELAHRGIYNWFQIRHAIKNQPGMINRTFKTIEEANVFDELSNENTNLVDDQIEELGPHNNNNNKKRPNSFMNALALSTNPKAVERIQQERQSNYLLKRSLPRSVEYWRRMQHEMAQSSGLPEYIRPYEIPKMRLFHRIEQPDTSRIITPSKEELNAKRHTKEANELRSLNYNHSSNNNNNTNMNKRSNKQQEGS